MKEMMIFSEQCRYICDNNERGVIVEIEDEDALDDRDLRLG
jgi:hypothetical protein